MLITIQQFTLPCENLADGAYKLRLWYNQGFLDSSGQAVAPGTSTNGTQLRSDATVAGGFITFDPFTVYSTLDAEVPAPQSVQIACQLFKGNTALPIYPFQQNGTPGFWIVPDDLGATISFEEWTIANQRIVLANPPLTFYTAAQVDALIETNNIQVAFNQDYVITAYASLSAAVTAAALTDGTLVINEATACPADLTVPSNVTLRFTRKGSIVMTSLKTLTILGPIEADPVKIFFNALSGQGTVSLTSTGQGVRPEWWTSNTTPGTTDMTAAINAAIQAAPSGGYIQLAAWKYLLSGVGTELILIDRNVSLIGSGTMSSNLRVAGSVGASTDVIRIAVAGETRFMRLNDFRIEPVTTTPSPPARYGVNLDITNSGQLLANMDIARLYIEILGSDSIHLTNPIPNLDGFFTSDIHDNFIVPGAVGINLADNMGDSVWIKNNTIAGASAGIGIIIGAQAGAVKSVIDSNNITTAGGAIKIVSGSFVTISNNNIEQIFPYSGSSGAMVDIDGSGGDCILTVIENNTINARGTATNLIRVDTAENTVISNNNLQKGTGSSILITANALKTNVEFQRWGTAEIAPSITDNGIATRGVRKTLSFAGTGWANNGVPVEPAYSYLDTDGFVHLHGFVVATNVGAPSYPLPNSICTLPQGHRPADQIDLGPYGTAGGGPGFAQALMHVRITSGGVVIIVSGPTSIDDGLSLDSIVFKASEP